jgi:SulP family sulfate permease
MADSQIYSIVKIANLGAVPIDNAQYARSVREDTAELASYALSDKASTRSMSPPPPSRPRQTLLESYFSQALEEDTVPSRSAEGLHRHPIPEVSEPVSPESGASSAASSKSPGTSVLTNMLKRSPPSTLLPDRSEDAEPNEDTHSQHSYTEEGSSENSRLIITSTGLKIDATERTPLLAKYPGSTQHHPNYIGGEQDVEGQEVRRRASWPKLRHVVMWPKERGLDIAKIVMNPKAWDRKVIWQRTVAEPIGYLPAVILGLLLNILDALSYGMSIPH